MQCDANMQIQIKEEEKKDCKERRAFASLAFLLSLCMHHRWYAGNCSSLSLSRLLCILVLPVDVPTPAP